MHETIEDVYKAALCKEEQTITFPYTKSAVEGAMAVFDDTVHKIMKKDFHRCADDAKVCRNCDFRYYCKNK